MSSLEAGLSTIDFLLSSPSLISYFRSTFLSFRFFRLLPFNGEAVCTPYFPFALTAFVPGVFGILLIDRFNALITSAEFSLPIS